MGNEVSVIRLQRFLGFLLLLAVAIPAAAQSGKALITGVVAARDGGKGIQGLSVSAQSTTVPAQGPPETVVGTTDKDGIFTIAGLAGGAYKLCVDAAPAGYLNPCEWSSAVTASAGMQAVAPTTIRLDSGAVISIRVNDPGSAKADLFGGDLNTFVRPLVWSDGVAHAGRADSSGKGGHDFTIVIPFDKQVQLAIDFQNLTVTDAGAKALTTTTQYPLMVSSGDSAKRTMSFSIGKKP